MSDQPRSSVECEETLCLPARLVIELDGDTHGNDGRQGLDAIRTETIERAGYRVIRFWNDEVFNNADGVI
ncbi:MAG TPA: DUF559 domain-containing protein, partial [Candidatus Dormibacteraeota bacterium]|nr:DUF559 domain-containing protein [Candidatus Dormibacteraeota bacterium]